MRTGRLALIVSLLGVLCVASVVKGQDPSPAEAAAVAQAGDPALLVLKHAAFDPVRNPPALPPELAWTPGAPGSPDYFVVQLLGTPGPSDRDGLRRLGADILEYVPNNAYLVRVAPEAVPAIVRLPSTRAVLPLPPAFRVDPEALLNRGAEPQIYGVFLFSGEAPQPLLEALAAAGAAILDSGTDDASRLRILAMPDLLPAIAAVRAVAWVQRETDPQLRNDLTSWVIQSNVGGWTPIWNQGIYGENQVVGHIDSPLDLANCYFNDPLVPAAGPTHRKVVYHGGSTSTTGNHGAHTAGTVAGDQQPVTGSIFRNGMAYKARIAHRNLSQISSTNLATSFQTLFDNGARVFTNSWGNDGTTSYDAWARDIDVFSRNNEDALVMFAVTNLSSLKNPENAKDVLAVGATSKAPNQANHCTGGTGPTSDGRRKPEIYAPGCGILSADAGTACSTQSMSGTSMACPAITGSAAQVRQYFTDGFYPTGAAVPGDAVTPTGALVKAVLLNAAVDMTGVAGYPSNQEGWGRLLLDNALYFAGDLSKLYAVDVRLAQGFTAAGEQRTYTVVVSSATAPLEITLVWHDPPAALMAASTPINNLNLRVTGPTGLVYLGNVFAGGQSATGGAFDLLNNVERFRLAAPATGAYKIEVLAAGIPTPNQGFALAVNGDITPAGTFTGYGMGLAGSGGFVPALAGGGSASIGGTVTFTVTQGLGGTVGLLGFGFAPDAIPVLGGTLWVQPPLYTTDISLGGSAGVPGAGTGSVALAIPFEPAIVALHVHFQAGLADPGAVQAISLTNAVDFFIGY